MSAVLHKSLDETVIAIRETHAAEIQAANDRVLAAEVKATLLEDQLARAVEARASAERLATKLITQFGAVEAIFADAKALALSTYVTEPDTSAVSGNKAKIDQILTQKNAAGDL